MNNVAPTVGIEKWRLNQCRKTVHILEHLAHWIADNSLNDSSQENSVDMLFPLIRSLDEHLKIEPGQK